jgi:iron-sulfur cluster repair protein YtfE (RIC family)
MSDGSHFDGREMAMVHRMFRREFLLAPAVVRQVAGGDAGRAHAVAAHLELIISTLHHHHAGEDEHVWPLLQQRAPVDVSWHVLRVEEQHRQVDTATKKVAESLARWRRDPTADRREQLAVELETLVGFLVDHMDYEETHVVPVMESHIGIDEWNEIVQSMVGDLIPDQMSLVLGMNMYEGDQDIIDDTIANMPPEAQDMIRSAAVEAYAEHAQRVYGTATPPRGAGVR